MTNIELWGVNVDFKSYEKKWAIHGIMHNMGSILQQRIHVSLREKISKQNELNI